MVLITLGKVDKKLYLIIIILIVNLIDALIRTPFSEYINDQLDNVEGELSCIIVGITVYFIFKSKKKKTESKKKNFKYLIVFFILKLIKTSYDILYYRCTEDPKYKYDILLNTINGVEILLISLVTFILLKYKYYIHHIIFMVIFFVSAICNEIIFDNYSLLEYKYIYIYIIYIINEIILYCYLKYMMDVYFYHYIELLIMNGIFGLIIIIIIYLGIIIHEHMNDNEELIPSLLDYFKETNAFSIIIFHFFYLFLENGIYMLITLLILYYLRPNHIIISDSIQAYYIILYFNTKPNKYYTLIIFILQILSLLFLF